MSGIQFDPAPDRPNEHFTMLGHANTRNTGPVRLTGLAMALHHYLLSLPPGWRIGDVDSIADEVFPMDSREEVRQANRELMNAGLVVLKTTRAARGQFERRYQVFHNPQAEDARTPSKGRQTSRRQTGVRCDQAKREFPQVAPAAGTPAAGKAADKNLKTDTEDCEKTEKDLLCVAPSTSVVGTGRDVSDSQERNHLEDPAPLAATLASFTAPRDPANAEKNKMLTAFATGGLAKARSDVTDLRPSSTRFADLCKLHFLPPSECARVGLPHDPPRSARETQLEHAA